VEGGGKEYRRYDLESSARIICGLYDRYAKPSPLEAAASCRDEAKSARSQKIFRHKKDVTSCPGNTLEKYTII
jgi:hypothetical protein